MITIYELLLRTNDTPAPMRLVLFTSQQAARNYVESVPLGTKGIKSGQYVLQPLPVYTLIHEIEQPFGYDLIVLEELNWTEPTTTAGPWSAPFIEASAAIEASGDKYELVPAEAKEALRQHAAQLVDGLPNHISIKMLATIKELEDLIELDENQELTQAQKNAIIIHSTDCYHNHTDGCGWYYEIKNDSTGKEIHDWSPYTAHSHYLSIAESQRKPSIGGVQTGRLDGSAPHEAAKPRTEVINVSELAGAIAHLNEIIPEFDDDTCATIENAIFAAENDCGSLVVNINHEEITAILHEWEAKARVGAVDDDYALDAVALRTVYAVVCAKTAVRNSAEVEDDDDVDKVDPHGDTLVGAVSVTPAKFRIYDDGSESTEVMAYAANDVSTAYVVRDAKTLQAAYAAIEASDAGEAPAVCAVSDESVVFDEDAEADLLRECAAPHGNGFLYQLYRTHNGETWLNGTEVRGLYVIANEWVEGRGDTLRRLIDKAAKTASGLDAYYECTRQRAVCVGCSPCPVCDVPSVPVASEPHNDNDELNNNESKGENEMSQMTRSQLMDELTKLQGEIEDNGTAGLIITIKALASADDASIDDAKTLNKLIAAAEGGYCLDYVDECDVESIVEDLKSDAENEADDSDYLAAYALNCDAETVEALLNIVREMPAKPEPEEEEAAPVHNCGGCAPGTCVADVKKAADPQGPTWKCPTCSAVNVQTEDQFQRVAGRPALKCPKCSAIKVLGS